MALQVAGINEARAGLQSIGAGLNGALSEALIEGTADVDTELKTYPPEPPYMGMRNFGAYHNMYVRTGYYGQNVHSSVADNGQKVTGYVEQGAPYSYWLRGDGEGYPGAWMHVPFWKSIASVVAEYTPKVTALVEAKIMALVQRVFGGVT